MQEQVNEKTIALSSRSAKMTAHMLAKMMQAYLRYRQRVKGSKARIPKPGQKSIKSLTAEGASIADIDISGDNIGSFKKIARKYNIEFALKKDDSVTPTNWVVFFKSRDNKAIESAFKEYTKLELLQKTKKPSLLTQVAKFKEQLKEHFPPVRNKKREGHEL